MRSETEVPQRHMISPLFLYLFATRCEQLPSICRRCLRVGDDRKVRAMMFSLSVLSINRQALSAASIDRCFYVVDVVGAAPQPHK